LAGYDEQRKRDEHNWRKQRQSAPRVFGAWPDLFDGDQRTNEGTPPEDNPARQADVMGASHRDRDLRDTQEH
jgi:hypothetical protein